MLAASIASPGRLCRPASRISIMNGVHCQISDDLHRQPRVLR